MALPWTRKEHPRRRGAVIVMTAVCLVTLLIFAAFAVDVGYICALTAEQQNTADAGSLAGAVALQEGDAMSALERVKSVIERNQRQQGYVSLDDQIIEMGWWDSANQVFTALPPEEWEDGAFAVRVRAARNETPLFFAGVMGFTETDVSREAVAIGSRPCGGIWGLAGVKAGSVYTDSYDPDDGPYDPLTAGDEGDICSGQDITIVGSIQLHGDAMAGFGHQMTVSGSAAQITGVTTASVDALPDTSLDMDDATYVNDNDQIDLTSGGTSPWKGSGYSLDVQGQQNLTLDPGTYYLDSIKLSGGATITITGPTTIYVTGDIDATGGAFVNETQDPRNLEIISSGSAVKISGGTAFYGSILAPDAAVVLSGSGAGFYGALIGGTVDLKGDVVFHVDETSPLTRMFEPPPVMLVR